MGSCQQGRTVGGGDTQIQDHHTQTALLSASPQQAPDLPVCRWSLQALAKLSSDAPSEEEGPIIPTSPGCLEEGSVTQRL